MPKGTKSVSLSAEAISPECRLKMTDGSGNSKKGGASLSFDVQMPENKYGVPPIWEVPVEVEVLPPAGDAEAALTSKGLVYIVLISIEVSTFAELSDLNTGHTPCEGGMKPPKFSPNVTDYSCVFFWQDSKYAVIQVDIDESKCRRLWGGG